MTLWCRFSYLLTKKNPIDENQFHIHKLKNTFLCTVSVDLINTLDHFGKRLQQAKIFKSQTKKRVLCYMFPHRKPADTEAMDSANAMKMITQKRNKKKGNFSQVEGHWSRRAKEPVRPAVFDSSLLTVRISGLSTELDREFSCRLKWRNFPECLMQLQFLYSCKWKKILRNGITVYWPHSFE